MDVSIAGKAPASLTQLRDLLRHASTRAAVQRDAAVHARRAEQPPPSHALQPRNANQLIKNIKIIEGKIRQNREGNLVSMTHEIK